MGEGIGRRSLLAGGAVGAMAFAGAGRVAAKAHLAGGGTTTGDPWVPLRAACKGRAAPPIWLQGVSPDKAHATVAKDKPEWPGTDYKVERANGLYIERNIKIPMRDGKIIYADIFRPDDERRNQKLPVLISWSPYGKHQPQTHRNGDGVDDAWISKFNVFENPNPEFFSAKHGYAMILCDAKGSWGSQGDLTFFDQADAEGFYDAIEWAGVQPWSTGAVGTMGVSSYTMNQWRVAVLHPPHLKCILPWEGSTDLYRERNYRGGIQENFFIPRWAKGNTVSTGKVEDWLACQIAHPMIDCYYTGKQPDFRTIKIPAFVGASWSDQGIHTRGTLEGYRLLGSEHKWLLVHGRNKWGTYVSPEMREKQRLFYDRFLKGEDNALKTWPKVQMDVRERANTPAIALRPEREFPLARTRYTKLHLDAASRKLGVAAPAKAASLTYDTEQKEAVTFDLTFDRDTEITGYASLRLWVETPTETDMDLFVALQKLDRDGKPVGFNFASTWDQGPVALGWLRASHRALDVKASTPQQPIHLHTHRDMLTPGKPVALDIEIWPSSTLFHKGETLRLVVKGSDIYDNMPPSASIIAHATLNKGQHVLHTGGPRASYLLVPIIPAKA